MKQKITLCLALVGLLALGGQAIAEIGTIDDVPAATLLLPYFAVDLNPAGSSTSTSLNNGITTLFSINNASATAILAHVTLWTDESIPTLDFDVYLTGYDVQTINIRDIFNGNLPVTASAGQDPKDAISPKGPASQDINFASCTGRLPFTNPALNATLLAHIRAAHTGGPSAVFSGRCSGFNYGDNVARGYITVDTVNSCNLLFPNSTGYFTSVATFQNVLWGDYFYVNEGQNFASGSPLVHIEACQPGGGYVGYVGNGAGNCPFVAGDYTFYGRYVLGAGTDQREPLATTFATRYLNGGTFDGGTDLVVWRDSKTNGTGANGPFSCSAAQGPAWFPLNQQQVVAFDEQEHATQICIAAGDNVSPPLGQIQTCFPLETQDVSLQAGATGNPGDNPTPPYTFGWMYLNLNTSTGAVGGLFDPTAQAWVWTRMSALGRFDVGFPAIKLDNALYTNGTSGVTIPGIPTP
jgi:hypothetical protein